MNFRMNHLALTSILSFLVLINIHSCRFASNSSTPLVEEILTDVTDQSRFITPDELAHDLVNRDPSLKIVDVRAAADFEEFALPGAINVPCDQMSKMEAVLGFDPAKYQVIFYSNSSHLADKAWFICRSQGYRNTFVLKGGLNAWVGDILHPMKPDETASVAVQAQYDMRLAMRHYFLGLSVPLEAEPFSRTPPKKQIVLKPRKKKKVEEEEGC